jgi:hypothetical protein
MDWLHQLDPDASTFFKEKGPEPKHEIVVSPGLLWGLVEPDWFTREEVIDDNIRVHHTDCRTVMRISHAVD